MQLVVSCAFPSMARGFHCNSFLFITCWPHYPWKLLHIVVVQSLGCVQLFATWWTAAHQASQSFTISLTLLKLMSFESMMPSNSPILCHPLLLLPSIFPSIRVFSNELALCIEWPKYWSFSFSIGLSTEYSRLISFRIDWAVLAAQGTFQILLQYRVGA